MDAKVGALDTKVEALDTKVEALDAKVEALNTKADNLDIKCEKKFGELGRELGHLSVKTDQLETKVGIIDLKIETVVQPAIRLLGENHLLNANKLNRIEEKLPLLDQLERDVKNLKLEVKKCNATCGQ